MRRTSRSVSSPLGGRCAWCWRRRPRCSTTTTALVRSAHLELRTPLVIRLRYMVKVPYHRRTTMSRRAVFARDAHQCQYCGGHADSIDHVLPRSRGGPARVGERGRRLPAVQPPQARPHARRGGHAPAALAPSPPRELAWVVIAVGGVPEVWKPYLGQSQLTLGGHAPRRPRRASCTRWRCRRRRRREVWFLEPTRPALVLGSAQPESAVAGGRSPHAASRWCVAAAAGERCCSCPGEVLWVDVILPAGDPLWVDDVGRASHWLGEVWAAALAALRVSAGRRCTAGRWCAPSGRGLVCFAGLGPGRGDGGRPQGGRHQPAPNRGRPPGSSAWC